MWLMLMTLVAQASTPVVGLRWQPLGRADLAWVQDGRTSGVAVGEFDGFVRPNLSAYAGMWVKPHLAILGTLGTARLQTTTWDGDTYRQRHWGVVRPGVEGRLAALPFDAPMPIPWLYLGAHASLPSARDVSNGYSESEQAAADETAARDRAKLGGYGGRAGIGVTATIVRGVAVGATGGMYLHRNVIRDDDAAAVTAWLGGEAALLLEFSWPARQADRPTLPPDEPAAGKATEQSR